jgi:hypothetical protein
MGCSSFSSSSNVSERTTLLLVSDSQTALTTQVTSLPVVSSNDLPSWNQPITEPTDEKPFFSWNPYLFSGDLTEEPYYSTACQLVDAINSYAPFLSVSNEEVGQAIADNFYYNYPPSALCSLSYQDGKIEISYFSTEPEHIEAISAFGKRVETILNQLLTGEETEEEKAVLLYRSVSQNISYFSIDYTDYQTSAYNGLMEGVTICYGFADSYNYLLRQVGISAELLRGCRAGDRAAHGWSLIQLNGNWYHCDPTWEHSGSGGKGLLYFGMTDQKRYETLSKLEGDTVTGFGSLERNYSLLHPLALDSRYTPWNQTIQNAEGLTWEELLSRLNN